MNTPRLSIIVPVYNVEKYIHSCINSILNQHFSDFELILVDDGSTDNCGKICDEYASSDKRVRIIHQENGDVSAARNKGIDVSQGEIIGFVDSDDIICADMYQKMVDFMDVHQLDAVCADTYLVKNCKETFRPRYDKDMLFSHLEAINEILDGKLDNAATNKIFKRKVIGNIRFPVGRIYEDVATVYRYIYQAEKVGYICRPYYYFKRKGSIVQTAFNSKGRYDCFRGYKERLEFSQKNNLRCIDKCEIQALETALATLTAFYATSENTESENFQDVVNYIKNHTASKFVNRLRTKGKFLIYCFQYCLPAYKLYAGLSAFSKKLKWY